MKVKCQGYPAYMYCGYNVLVWLLNKTGNLQSKHTFAKDYTYMS